jgi:predicted HTH transcriptional regulator
LQQGNERADDRIRSKFCSFANTNEGFLFFGIRDSDKEPVGIGNIHQEFTTRLNRIVSTKIFPGIPPQNYKAIHCIKNNDNRDIVIVKITKSSRNLIPHMFNCKIYIRENGESKPIKDGKVLKEKFSQRFYPSDIKGLENDLKNLSKLEVLYYPDFIDFMYLKELKVFLMQRFEESDSSEYIDLINRLQLILKKIEEFNKKPLDRNSEGISISILDEEQDIKDDLKRLIIDFTNQYKKVVLNNV